MRKIKIFIDMDGVLAVYDKNTAERMYDENFFLTRPPYENMVEAVKRLMNSYFFFDVYILSSVVDWDNHCKQKIEWIKKYIPELSLRKVIFVRYGESKAKAVENLVTEEEIPVLVDDYNKNLYEWNLPGYVAIKALNGINDNNKTWEGPRIDVKSSASEIVENLGFHIAGFKLKRKIYVSYDMDLIYPKQMEVQNER